MKKFLCRLLIAILLLLIATAVGLYFVPLKSIAFGQIKAALAGYGIKLNSLDIEHIDLEYAELSNINIGDDLPLKIQNINSKYSSREVINGKFNTIDIKGLQAIIYNNNNSWSIGGLEQFLELQSEPKEKAGIDFTMLKNKFPERVDISEAQLSLQDEDLLINIPFELSLTNTFEEIYGEITAQNLLSKGLPYDIPPLDLRMKYSLNETEISGSIIAHDAKKSFQANVDFVTPNTNFTQGKMTINTITIPYGGGTVSAKAVNIPFEMKKPINIILNLKNINLETLLGEVSGGKINGTGKISGAIPFTYYPDGRITVQGGSASASDSGIIIVSPDLLPGENEQLTIARDTLENFHYTTLKIAVSSDSEEKSIIALTLEGNNPEANYGRPVKLNVNLSGDIISLIKNSLLAINDLKQLLHIKEK